MELRVFICSTFADLQEEREYLIKKIFPEIRSLCRTRGITFTEVDLRWGVTDEQLALGRVIRTCLEEIDKCRPYLIGITGNRYGFIPTYTEIQKDPGLLEQYPWIEDAALAGMSITEMEAQYGVLNPGVGGRGPGIGDKAENSRARFYFRRHRASLDDAGGGDDGEQARLNAYQERIRQSGAHIEEFRDPVSLGELIYDDLIGIIKNDFADARPPTPLEQERARHQAFSLSRRNAYIANPDNLKALNEHAASDSPPLVVYAESGSGKSSLFAYWAEQYRRRNPQAHIIEHYVGIGTAATDHYAIIRHVCMEVKELLGREEDIPSDPKQLDFALGQWLGYADHELAKRGERLIVILDGLNQLQGAGLSLRWIPDVIPSSIRLILSSTIEGTLLELRNRGWGQLGMQALTRGEREAIIVRYLAEYGKSLNTEQIRLIAGDHKCGHPLFLKTLMEELRLIARHEDLNARIHEYLASTGTEDMFQKMLERMEDDSGKRALQQTMSLLWASLTGLDQRELSELSGMARLKIATMMAGLDYHLVQKEGHLTFFHDYLRRAVEKRYLAEEHRKQQIHTDIADYFERTDITPRATRELLHQLYSADHTPRLITALSTMERMIPLLEGAGRYDIMEYWAPLVTAYDVEAAYAEGFRRWECRDEEQRNHARGVVATILEELGLWDGAIRLQRERCAHATTPQAGNEHAEARRRLGIILRSRGAYDQALDELTQAKDLFTQTGDQDGIARVNAGIGFVYISLEKYDLAAQHFQRQLNFYEQIGDRGGVANATGNLGAVYNVHGEYDRALECYRQQWISCQQLGERIPAAKAIGNMGIVYYNRGEYDLAMTCFQQHLKLCEELGNRSGSTYPLGNMGVLYAMRGQYDRAMECFRRELDICEQLGDRHNAAKAIGNMGDVYRMRGQYDQSLQHLHRAAREHRAMGVRTELSAWLTGIAEVLVDIATTLHDIPEYLPTYLPDANGNSPESHGGWQPLCLQQARLAAEESAAICKEISNPDALFEAEVLLARIVEAEGNRGLATEQLEAMLAGAARDHQRAELHYWLWRLGAAGHDTKALTLYQTLYATTPKYNDHKRIQELQASS